MHTAPAWDPRQYLRYADHRARPVQDMLDRIPELPSRGRPARIADLGCGPGNLTVLLSERWPQAHITGLDNSPGMLREAQRHAGPTPGGGHLSFAPADAAQWTPEEPYDLIVSSAALQWVPNHPQSLERWTASLPRGGTLAFQVPDNITAPSHALLHELCTAPRWHARLAGHGRRFAHILETADYMQRLLAAHCTVDAWETTYLRLLSGEDAVLGWVMGTALRPVLTALEDSPGERDAFLTEYRDLLRKAYPPGPHGTVFPFRRIFLVAHKEA